MEVRQSEVEATLQGGAWAKASRGKKPYSKTGITRIKSLNKRGIKGSFIIYGDYSNLTHKADLETLKKLGRGSGLVTTTGCARKSEYSGSSPEA